MHEKGIRIEEAQNRDLWRGWLKTVDPAWAGKDDIKVDWFGSTDVVKDPKKKVSTRNFAMNKYTVMHY